jgi:hypothetical protein
LQHSRWEEQQRALLERFGSNLEEGGEEEDEEDNEDEDESGERAAFADIDALHAKALEYGVDMNVPTTNKQRRDRRKGKGGRSVEDDELELEFEMGGAGIPTGDAIREMSNADFLTMVGQMHSSDFEEEELGEWKVARSTTTTSEGGGAEEEGSATPGAVVGKRRGRRRRRGRGGGLRKG